MAEETDTAITPEPTPPAEVDEGTLAQDVLVEEVSIDGMCGVY